MKKIIYLHFVFLFFLKMSYAQYTNNYAGHFNGTSSYIAVPNTPNLNPINAITLEAWIYPEGTSASSMTIMSKGLANSYYLGISQDRRVIFIPRGGIALYSRVLGTVPLNQWTHIAGTYDGGTTAIYINGFRDTTTTAITGAIGGNSDSLIIGGDRTSGFPALFFKGRLDNVRIWASARSNVQIIENRFLCLEIFGSTGAYSTLRASFQLDAHATNYGGNSLETGYARNLNYIQYVNKAVNYLDYNSSLVVNGTTDYFSVNNHSSFNITNAITLEAWIRRDTIGTGPGVQNIVNKSGASSRYDYALLINSTGVLTFEINSGSHSVSTPPLITNGQWTHVAATYNPAGNGYAILYINGIYITSTSFAGNPLIQNNPDKLYIGGIGATAFAANKFRGQIDEVRIWRVERTPTQIYDKMYTDGSDNNMVDFSFDRHTSAIQNGNTTTFAGNTFAGSAHFSSSHLHNNNELTSPIIAEEFGSYPSNYAHNFFRFYIPDNNTSGVTDSILINSSGSIQNLKAYVLMNHTFVSNMILTLISPSGTPVTLFNRKGTDGNDIMTIFSDEADSVASYEILVNGPGIAAPFSAGIKPHQPLSAFNGQNKQGWWKLKFVDDAGFGKGYAHRWGINITSVPYKTLKLTALIQGFYSSSTDKMKKDTARVFLRNASSPYALLDTAKAVLDSNGKGNFLFDNISGSQVFYIVVKHRNSIETWSSTGRNFSNDTLSYNFTLASSQAFGSNQTQVDASPVRFAIYNGDVNNDGVIDVTDCAAIDNDAFEFVMGYVISDLTGDNIVDVSDAAIADNNSFNFVSKIRP